VKVTGTDDLRRRLAAIQDTFRPAGRAWAKEMVGLARPDVPVDTRRLRRSFKVKSATKKKAVVGAHYTAYFIDAGTHYPKVSRRKGGRPVFQRAGYRTRPRPFRERLAREALRRKPLILELVRQWNEAA
jgi:hypothetical protein